MRETQSYIFTGPIICALPNIQPHENNKGTKYKRVIDSHHCIHISNNFHFHYHIFVEVITGTVSNRTVIKLQLSVYHSSVQL